MNATRVQPVSPPHRDDGARRLQEFHRAARHTQRVRFFRVALAVSGMAGLAAFVFLLFGPATSLPEIDIGSTKIEDGKLVMDNPQVKGSDQNNLPYDLTAKKAIQDAANPGVVTLEEIVATLPLSKTSSARIMAGSGVYDTERQFLDLDQEISVRTDDGVEIKMRNVAIDVDIGAMKSDLPVSVDTGDALITADSLHVSEQGKTIVFDGTVKMHIRPASEVKAKPGDRAGN